MFNQSIHSNLNQIAQICNQLSSNEQNAAQQLRQCAQLAQSVSQQLQSMMSSAQFGTVGQTLATPAFTAPVTTGYQSPWQTGPVTTGVTGGNWANRPIATHQFTAPASQFAGTTGQYGITGKYPSPSPDLG